MPGAKGFVIAGFVGRMPMSMLGIGIVLLISALTGSYATAGAISATVSVAYAIAAPLSGRLVDRFGQARVLIPFVLTHGAALASMMLFAEYDAPQWTLFASGVVVGGTATSLGSMVRARWSHLLGRSAMLHTAFSFESVADEMIFVAGPALVTGLATMVNPYAGLILTLVCTVAGTVAFSLQRGTEPPVRPVTEHGGSPIMIPGVALLSCVFLAMGAVFGSIDLITVAFAEEHGAKAASGLLLASFAGGSMISGLWFGSRAWKISLGRRFTRGLIIFAVGMAPILLVSGLWSMALVAFVSGFAISPIIITGYALVERLVPGHLLTEGMSWISTAVGLGVAIGAWAGGRMTDAFGPSNAYVFSYGCALLALAVGVGGGTLLRTPETGPSEAPSTC
ncbi:MFS transporter [Sphaerisporangium krabiense]|uniref:MFS family permease n=1 Tax=Sphaerisporangium krabiense TaxID=763782 RepID=A0A7W8ZAA2_9ACTN|nr:MFS transporter [Sphaerisporangium krabiense]MBB5630374.1 MFS family permease [Sphaerisporangium krabiense]GII62672.1 MFS transporter [Sphaerisporangium krabiense]